MKRYLFEVWIQNFACSLEVTIASQREICRNDIVEAIQADGLDTYRWSDKFQSMQLHKRVNSLTP